MIYALSRRDNTVIFLNEVLVGGFRFELRGAEGLKGKTVTLEIQNAEYSVFSGNKLVKITENQDGRLVHPTNIPSLVDSEYLPATATRAEFTLPPDFDGKLVFTFYHAYLKGLAFTMMYN